MIRVRQIKISIEKDNEEELLRIISKKIKVSLDEINSYKIVKKSLDARFKPDLYYIYEVDIEIDNYKNILDKKYNDVIESPNEDYVMPSMGNILLSKRPVIVGSGPAGLFCGYLLSIMGYKPLIIERGDEVDKRIEKVDKFFSSGIMDTESNVQFGEGGAGTFSDGKLNTLTKDKYNRGRFVFNTFVECGANNDILISNMPHIGTDVLRDVVKNIRNKIIDMGGEFLFNTCLTNINVYNGKIRSIEVNNRDTIDTDILVLAIGHSARDTFSMLYNSGVTMESKSFSVGVRVQHLQEMINVSQYGENYNKKLNPASYILT